MIVLNDMESFDSVSAFSDYKKAADKSLGKSLPFISYICLTWFTTDIY